MGPVFLPLECPAGQQPWGGPMPPSLSRWAQNPCIEGKWMVLGFCDFTLSLISSSARQWVYLRDSLLTIVWILGLWAGVFPGQGYCRSGQCPGLDSPPQPVRGVGWPRRALCRPVPHVSGKGDVQGESQRSGTVGCQESGGFGGTAAGPSVAGQAWRLESSGLNGPGG